MIFNMTSGKMKTPVLSISYPANVTVNAGTGAAFQVQITEDGLPKEYTYQWYVNGTAVSGATSATYTRDTASDKGVYSVYCVVTSKAGSVTSRTATLTVQKTPVLNGSYPENAAVAKYTAVTCQVSVSIAGYPDAYTYQWYVNDAAVSGATGATYTFTPTAAGIATVFCKVTNAAGTVTSRTATITVTDLYLYNEGDPCAAVTGGWTTATNNIIWTFHSDCITYRRGGDEGNYGCIYTGNKIDITAFSNLNVDVEATVYAEEHMFCMIFVNSNNTDQTHYNGNYAASLIKTNSGRATLSLDISSLSGSYYVGFESYVNDGTIYKIWLS